MVVVAFRPALRQARQQCRRRSRGGRTIIFSDLAGLEQIGEGAAYRVEMPELDPFGADTYAVPMQLFAYYTAVAKGTDRSATQPRQVGDGGIATRTFCFPGLACAMARERRTGTADKHDHEPVWRRQRGVHQPRSCALAPPGCRS